jgi:hypothetical protein
MMNQKAVRMSPAKKVFQMLDTLLPDPQAMRFIDSTRAPAASPNIGMPSLRVFKPATCETFTYHRLQAPSPLATMTDPALLGFLYRSLRDDALASDPDALNDLGWLWINGSRTPQDTVLARRLFKLAYVLGSAEAAFNLAEQALHGQGMRVDQDLAVSYYEQAYERGIVQAARALGRLHEQGVAGQAPDCRQALQWYRRAAEHAFVTGEKCYGY